RERASETAAKYRWQDVSRGSPQRFLQSAVSAATPRNSDGVRVPASSGVADDLLQAPPLADRCPPSAAAPTRSAVRSRQSTRGSRNRSSASLRGRVPMEPP